MCRIKSVSRHIIAIVLLAGTLSGLLGQDPWKPEVYVDLARYRYDAQNIYVEICYSVSAAQRPEGSTTKNLTLLFQLSQQDNHRVLAEQQVPVHLEALTSQKNPMAKLGLIKTVIPAGKYVLKVFQQLDSEDPVPIGEYPFSAESFAQSRITLSDLVLCSNIIPHSPRKKSPFFKNTMEVMPNPSRIFDIRNTHRLYYYIELYNTRQNVPGSPLDIQVVLFDREGQIRASKRYQRPRDYPSLVEKGAFNISKLESGLYTLSFIVTDSSRDYSVYRRENFVIHNPNVQLVTEEEDPELAFLRSEFYDMPEEVVDEYFEKAIYIARKEEREVYESLTSVESKRRFLFDFWWKREKKQPGLRKEYYARAAYAEQHFSATGIPGWQTDRGRVYILYGPPDNIERNPVQPGTNPYEIWFYEQLEGGSEFDFVDFSGFGNYQLVNSTVRNEIQDPNWRRLLNKNP